MTWSIIAREARTGRVGIAVATCAFAAGARVPHVRTSAGAVATQAATNVGFGRRGLDLMAGGLSAAETIERLIASDDGRDHRQVHVMDRFGRFAAYTGALCIDWFGHHVGSGYSVAGNMLAGPQVVAATAETYEAQADLPLARRLLAAMRAGEAAGGDKRGRQSAALLVHDADEFAMYDLRVDDHVDPLAEIQRLHGVALKRAVHLRRCLLQDPSIVGRSGEIEARIAASIAEGYE